MSNAAIKQVAVPPPSRNNGLAPLKPIDTPPFPGADFTGHPPTKTVPTHVLVPVAGGGNSMVRRMLGMPTTVGPGYGRRAVTQNVYRQGKMYTDKVNGSMGRKTCQHFM
mmetsp:Transcript_29819/g.64572  ORF Transcript_29819/g.64572 Transcript_29819/m.64572 type:complete len:109 (+) Transcript_29819:3264-3590(+)